MLQVLFLVHSRDWDGIVQKVSFKKKHERRKKTFNNICKYDHPSDSLSVKIVCDLIGSQNKNRLQTKHFKFHIVISVVKIIHQRISVVLLFYVVRVIHFFPFHFSKAVTKICPTEIMQINGQSFIILLVFLFQSVRGNQNAAFDKNYSDRLTANYNQQSTLEVNNNEKKNTQTHSEKSIQKSISRGISCKQFFNLFRIDL